MEFSQEQKLYAQVVQEAWDNTQFKKDLVAKPEEAIERLTGHKMNLPLGQTFVVNDQTDESITYFNIPRKVDTSSMELTDEQLEMVAGGDISLAAWGAAVAVVSAIGASFAWGYSVGKDLAQGK